MRLGFAKYGDFFVHYIYLWLVCRKRHRGKHHIHVLPFSLAQKRTSWARARSEPKHMHTSAVCARCPIRGSRECILHADGVRRRPPSSSMFDDFSECASWLVSIYLASIISFFSLFLCVFILLTRGRVHDAYLLRHTKTFGPRKETCSRAPRHRREACNRPARDFVVDIRKTRSPWAPDGHRANQCRRSLVVEGYSGVHY